MEATATVAKDSLATSDLHKLSKGSEQKKVKMASTSKIDKQADTSAATVID